MLIGIPSQNYAPEFLKPCLCAEIALATVIINVCSFLLSSAEFRGLLSGS